MKVKFVFGLGVIAVVICLASVTLKDKGSSSWRSIGGKSTGANKADNYLSNLLASSSEQLSRINIERVNLICAERLPGTDDSNTENNLIAMDRLVTRVKSETDRHFYRFKQNPVEFENSEGFFRMVMIAVVLAEDFHVQYDPNRIGAASNARAGDGFSEALA